MDAKKFDELMKARHSVRCFQKKEIPENTLKQIITTALQTPSWCNSQAWNIYVASGKTLSEIKNIYKTKSQEKIKGYSDIKPGHRTEASQRSQKTMEQFFKGIAEFTKDPKMQALSDSQISLFNIWKNLFISSSSESLKSLSVRLLWSVLSHTIFSRSASGAFSNKNVYSRQSYLSIISTSVGVWKAICQASVYFPFSKYLIT